MKHRLNNTGQVKSKTTLVPAEHCLNTTAKLSINTDHVHSFYLIIIFFIDLVYFSGTMYRNQTQAE